MRYCRFLLPPGSECLQNIFSVRLSRYQRRQQKYQAFDLLYSVRKHGLDLVHKSH